MENSFSQNSSFTQQDMRKQALYSNMVSNGYKAQLNPAIKIPGKQICLPGMYYSIFIYQSFSRRSVRAEQASVTGLRRSIASKRSS